jgi:hypothetical protein
VSIVCCILVLDDDRAVSETYPERALRDAETSSVSDDPARWLRERPTRRIISEGRADKHGTNEYHLALVERGAPAVTDLSEALCG